MIEPTRRGALWRTASIEETRRLAEQMGLAYVTSLAELSPGGTAALDLDVVSTVEAVDIGRRFRALGVRLVMAARPGAAVAPDVRCNLAEGH